MTQNDLRELADLIRQEIKNEFKSGVLCDTIYVTEVKGEVVIHIPAPEYDQATKKRTGAIVYKNNGKSFASTVDEKGEHKDFAERAVRRAIEIWLVQNRKEAEVQG